MTTTYEQFLESKQQQHNDAGFTVDPKDLNPQLFDWQRELVSYSLRKGRSAIFADCGLGKTPMQLAWAEQVLRETNKPVLILAPLAVSPQTVREGEKFGIEVRRSADGIVHTGINVTNYERLHYFDPMDFGGVVCDESSILKHFTGATQKSVTEFMRRVPYRLLCTATAAPNDYIELGTSAEALGVMGHMDMLGTFFKNDEKSLHPIWFGARWTFKPHAERSFWRWVAGWARAIRTPSDMGYPDGDFILPELKINQTVVKTETNWHGQLFPKIAETLDEQRKERRATLTDRCEMVAEKLSHDQPAIAWGYLNDETDLIESLIPDAVQVSGSDSDEDKEAKLMSFVDGNTRVLVTKPTIAGFGLNFQHCAHMTFFPSHSFEQYYQAVRRCWRFGQHNPVTVDIITSEGEVGVMANLQRKADASEKMFAEIVQYMNDALTIESQDLNTERIEVPSWL